MILRIILVGVELPLRVVVTILECCVTFSGVKLSIRSFVLLLQKPSARSKAKDHSEALLRRIDWFQSGDIERLIAEGREIQRRLKLKKSQQDISKTFSKLMMEGKIHSALRFLSEESQGGIHQLSEKILKDLRQQHQAPTEIQRNSLLFGPICDLRDIRFDIDEQKIAEAAQLTKGAAGPSSLDANQFKRILCSKQFNKEGKDLQDQISIFAKNIAIKVTDPSCLEAYTANRLIPLDKNPGIRPIGIGEVLRRIVGKAIKLTLRRQRSPSKYAQAIKLGRRLQYMPYKLSFKRTTPRGFF